MTQLPAFCDNCNIFFESGFGFGGNGTLITEGCTTSCPKCGKLNPVPDGVFKFVKGSIDLFNSMDITLDRLAKIKQTLIDIKENNINIDNAQKQINNDLPELNSLSSFLPKTRIELYTFLGVLVAIIGLLITSYSSGKQQPIEYNTFINNYSYYENTPKQISNGTIDKKIQRNEPCKCGSGKKFKFCHGKN